MFEEAHENSKHITAQVLSALFTQSDSLTQRRPQNRTSVRLCFDDLNPTELTDKKRAQISQGGLPSSFRGLNNDPRLCANREHAIQFKHTMTQWDNVILQCSALTNCGFG